MDDPLAAFARGSFGGGMKEEEIRPKHLLERYLQLSAEDVAREFPDPSILPARSCPACTAPEIRASFTKAKFEYVRCAACDTLYARKVPSPEAMRRFYRDSPSTKYWAEVFFPAVAEARRELIFRPRAEKVLALARRYGRVRSVIDIGAGTGLMLEELRGLDPALICRAVEPSVSMAETCRRKDFATFEGFAEDAASHADWAGSADLVTSFEVLEHLDDVKAFLASAAKLARRGALVLMSGLCGDGFDIRVLGAASNSVSPPHHLTFLSQAGVRRLLAACGLELLDFSTPGKLDVDIVRNKLGDQPGAVSDDFLSHLLLRASDEARAAFQDFLASHALSSHMWFVARRP